MLEHPCIRRYSSIGLSHPRGTMWSHVRRQSMGSENPTGGDNQQETASAQVPLHPDWVCGFVDGEGCFSVSIHRNPYVRRTRGWQINAVFQVSQHRDSWSLLEELV